MNFYNTSTMEILENTLQTIYDLKYLILSGVSIGVIKILIDQYKFNKKCKTLLNGGKKQYTETTSQTNSLIE